MRDLPDLLRRFWGMRDVTISPLGGGMNSQTWLVEHEVTRYVAKHVAASGLAGLVAGCETASMLAQAGFATGRPVPTTGGDLVLTEHAVALLEHLPGRELDGDTDEEQRWIATTLAGVHAAGRPASGLRTADFATDWLSPESAGVGAHPWLEGVLRAVRAETDHLTVTWSVLHTDPSPEAFIHDDHTGVTGLIDWAGSRRGPVLYDVASAVMYLGGEGDAAAFLDAYQGHRLLSAQELESLEGFRRFRWAVQAVYFAGRLAARDLTGIEDHTENEKGLSNARRGLSRLGLTVS